MSKKTLDGWVLAGVVDFASGLKPNGLTRWESPGDGSLRMMYLTRKGEWSAGVHTIIPREQLDSDIVGWRGVVADEIKGMRAALRKAWEVKRTE